MFIYRAVMIRVIYDRIHILTHWPLWDLNVILKILPPILLYWLVSSNLLMIMWSDGCHRTLLMISQHWFRQWLGVVRQQAITWTRVDQDLQCHTASLGPNELIQSSWYAIYCDTYDTISATSVCYKSQTPTRTISFHLKNMEQCNTTSFI